MLKENIQKLQYQLDKLMESKYGIEKDFNDIYIISKKLDELIVKFYQNQKN